MSNQSKEITPVLAMYNIRSKQKFIYETNKIKEIVGASQIITDVFNDYLYDDNIYISKEKFSYDAMQLRLGCKQNKDEHTEKVYHGEVVYEGGGNLFMVYQNNEVFVSYNKIFCKKLLENTNGLTPLFACVPISENYVKDQKQLMEICDRLKKQETPLHTANTLPFVLMDRNVWKPITKKEAKNEFTTGSSAKITKYAQVEKKTKLARNKIQGGEHGKVVEMDKVRLEEELCTEEIHNVQLLDELCTEKGRESLLAVVYIDGNNMGNKFASILKGKTDYDSCINTLREKSGEVDGVFVTEGNKAVKNKLIHEKQNVDEKWKHVFAWRSIVGGGDEITFICNARCALTLTKAYLKSVQETGQGDYSSCAGIAIFHSHYPFAKAYKVAEQCCEQAKNKLRDDFRKGRELCGIDFHYIHSSVQEDIEEIRKHQYTYHWEREAKENSFVARPYVFGETVSDMQATMPNFTQLEKVVDILKLHKVAHSVIKELGVEIGNSAVSAKKTLLRVFSQESGLQNHLEHIEEDQEKLLALLFDISELYDLWFTELPGQKKRLEKGERSDGLS
ncbi:MAG: hypothetical protein RR131_09480 [Anaerovorax sp.]